MAGDERNLLKLLESELRFIELGGFDYSTDASLLKQSIFRESLVCRNYPSVHTRSCQNCHLLDFVSVEHQLEDFPCHFIRLDDGGETIAGLRPVITQRRLIHMVKGWLRWKIDQLKLESAS